MRGGGLGMLGSGSGRRAKRLGNIGGAPRLTFFFLRNGCAGVVADGVGVGGGGSDVGVVRTFFGAGFSGSVGVVFPGDFFGDFSPRDPVEVPDVLEPALEEPPELVLLLDELPTPEAEPELVEVGSEVRVEVFLSFFDLVTLELPEVVLEFDELVLGSVEVEVLSGSVRSARSERSECSGRRILVFNGFEAFEGLMAFVGFELFATLR